MSRITIHNIESAPQLAKQRLENAAKANGFLPNLLGVLANSPIALETYQTVSAINAKSTLSPTEREVVQITAASLNGCGFCVAGHTKLAIKKLQLAPELVAGLRDHNLLTDQKLRALALFTTQIIDQKASISDDDLKAFKQAGYTEEQALEVVLGVSLATLCNYANNLAQTPINPELQEFANHDLPAYID